jgi:hypothetical protein
MDKQQKTVCIETFLNRQCRFVSDIIDNVFRRFYGDNDFLFSRREYFTNFDRRELSYTKNMILTLVSKFLLKYIWDCKTRFTIPNINNCWEALCDKILTLISINNKFRKLWEGSGFVLNVRAGNNNP